MSGDPTMTDSFINADDIHKRTAGEIFGVPQEFVTQEMRSHAKTINFGIIYGMGAYSLSGEIGTTVAKAKEYISEYFAHYGSVAEFMDKVVLEAKQTGYVRTMFGRLRPIPEILQTNKTVVALGERIAKNTPIQGSAADIMKIAMVKVHQKLKALGLSSKLVLQVHDELIVEGPLEESESVCELVTEQMESAAKLSVPLIAQAKSAKNWYDAK